MKKMCLFDHWVIQNKETVQEIAQTLQWKPSVTEKSTVNKQTHTYTHTPKDVDTEAAETQTQKIKTVRLAHPTQ